jgi:RHS repeat-associated protein
MTTATMSFGRPNNPQTKPPTPMLKPRQAPVSPDEARKIIEGRLPPVNIFRPKDHSVSNTISTIGNVRSAVAAGFASGTVLGAADLNELARALKNDVDNIFAFVHDNIEFLPTYGSQKGALGTLIDGMGNSFDQSELMVTLLRIAGYTASYQFGQLELTQADVAAWLGTDPSSIDAAAYVLNEGFIPNTIVTVGLDKHIQLSHCFVKVTISGTDYVFDPAKKTYSSIAGMNLATALGYNRTTFMTNASSGATVTSDYVKNMNRSNIRSNLNTFTANLIAYIKANKPDASLDDVIGGKTIVPVVGPIRQTGLSYIQPGTTPTTWSTDIPSTYYATLHVVYDDPNINVTFYSKDIHTKRLTITFNGSLQAELRLDGTLVATSSVQGFGGYNSVFLEPKHPYATTDADGTPFWMTVWTGHPYLIAQAWGNAGAQMVQIHQDRLKLNQFNGGVADSEPVIGEAFATIWHTWNAQNNRASDMINRLANSRTMYHHQVGLFGHFDTVYEDLPGIMWKTAPLDNNGNNVKINDNAMALHGIAFEAACLQQMVGIGGVSTTTIIDIANSAGNRIFDASSSNWLATVKPALTGYAAGDVTNIENWWVNAGWRVALPESGAQPKDDWTGFAYYALSPTQGTIGIISGSLKGGSGSQVVTTGNFGSVSATNTTDIKKQVSVGHASSTSVDLSSGQYSAGATDITIGSAGYPYGLSFNRSYRSTQRLDNAGLGLGWSHNHQMSILKYSNGLLSLADQSPIQGAAGIVDIFVAVDLQSDLTKPMDKWVTCALANQWLIDNITNNVVGINVSGEKSEHVRLPDGTFATPKGGASKLFDNGDGTFTLTTPQQVKYNFNTSGQIATIVFPQGVTITYTYASGLLSTVSNGMGRTLTFNYTGSLLSSVTDGTGRSVGFTIDGSNQLTAVTNPDSKVTTFSYVSAGLLQSIFLPANPLSAIITNTYDALNRIKQQTDAYGNVWTYYLAGSRAEEVDPANNSGVSYLSKSGLPLKVLDQLGNTSTFIYDGLDRVIQRTLPEGNSFVYSYDSNNNRLSVVAKAKPGSGLSDITNSFTYHPTWNVIATAVDGLGNTTTYSWNATTGTITSIQRPVIGGVTPTISFTYNSRGQVLTSTDETGIVTQFNYNLTLERLESIVQDQGAGRLNLTLSFGFDTVGNITSFTDARAKTSTAQYDSLRRSTQVSAPSPFGYQTNFVYDSNGNRTQIQRQTSNPSRPWQISSASYSIDNLLIGITDPDNKTTSFSYTNLRQLWKTTDAASRVVEKAYDARGFVYTVKDPALSVASTQKYSNNGLLSSVTDANNNQTNFDYDGFDRGNKTTYPDGSYIQNSSYDANGNVLTFRTRSGNAITNTFDALNRLATKSPTGQAVVTNTYDLAGRLSKVSTPVVSGDPTSGDFQYFTDTAGRLYKEQYPDGKTVTLQLDSNGNPTRTTWPDGYFIDRVFDELNRLTDIKLNGAGTSSLHFDFDALSRRTRLTYGSNVASTQYTFGFTADLTALAQTFQGSNVIFSYGFNDIKQLISQGVSDSQFIWHPSAGSSTSYGAANSLNQYPSVGGSAYTYNTAGCLTGDGTWTYGYDTENHLVSASTTGTSTSYRYDPSHRQGQKTVGTSKTRYIYSGWQRIADYDDTTGALQNRYVFGGGMDEALIQISAGGTISYFYQDRAGSVIATSDSTGAVTGRYRYSPNGESPSMSGSTFGFQGQRYDSDTGLYYMKYRYYNPKLGRFLQSDPVGYAAGLNMYNFVGNSPLLFTDPLGLGRSSVTGIYNFSWVDSNLRQDVAPASWIQLVAPGGGWDIKKDYNNSSLDGQMLEHLGNFNFGATGRKLGFSLPVLKTAASLVQWAVQIYQWVVPQTAGRLLAGKAPNLHWSNTKLEWFPITGGDDPDDAASITAGFIYGGGADGVIDTGGGGGGGDTTTTTTSSTSSQDVHAQIQNYGPDREQVSDRAQAGSLDGEANSNGSYRDANGNMVGTDVYGRVLVVTGGKNGAFGTKRL